MGVKQAKQEVGNWEQMLSVLRTKNGLYCKKKTIFFSDSVFGEVLETLPWLRESISMAARDKPNVFVMGVNVLDFNPLPSSPLAQGSAVKSEQQPLPDFSMSHRCACVVDAETILCSNSGL